MSPFRLGLLVATLGACASARNEPHDDVDAAIDAPSGSGMRDAAQAGCAQAFTGVLATWDFTGQPGNQASTAVKTTAPGVVAGPVQRATGLTAVSGADAINSSNWALTAQPDPTKYYAFTIAPPSGCTIAISALSIDAKASGTGPAMAVIATSIDSYVQTTAISTAAKSTPSLAPPPQVASIELRVFGYGATATAGTLRLQTTLSVTGSLQ